MAHYLPGPKKFAEDGSPMWIRVEDDGLQRWVVKRGEQYYYSDEHGTPLPVSNSGAEEFGGVLVGGLIGLLFGPAGVIAGAVIGGLAAKASKEKATPNG